RIAQRQWTPYFCGGLLIAFASLFMPRWFCGWVCPLGTCIDITDNLTLAKKRHFNIPTSGVLAAVVAAVLIVFAGFGSEAAGFMDPLTIVGNGFIAFLSPTFFADVREAFASGYFPPEILLLMIFFGILFLTVFGRRTWCRTLCPLGGLLGLLGKAGVNRRKVSGACINCGRCRKPCKMDSIGASVKDTLELCCISCMNCKIKCPKDCITFAGGKKETE
ncbi:MAG: 4Fe-4S binding protein, partial [Phycisphaerae bacterium]